MRRTQHVASQAHAEHERLRADEREVAAQWIEKKTGCTVSYFSDAAFRESFVDGKVLCEAVNAARPETVHKVLGKKYNSDGSVNQEHEELRKEVNFKNLLDGCRSLGIPEEYIPQRSMLEGNPEEATTRTLKFLEILATSAESGTDGDQRNALGGSRKSTRAAASTLMANMDTLRPGGKENMARRGRGVSATESVTRLMQQCTAILREKSSSNALSIDQEILSKRNSVLSAPSTTENMGPLLETVLGSLTQEYEKRLLSKEREISELKDALQDSRKQLRELKEEKEKQPVVPKTAIQTEDQEVSKTKAQDTNKKLLEVKKTIQDLQDGILALQKDLQAREEAKASLVEKIQECHSLLAEKAARYKSVVEENKVLYNQVQDLRGAIRVYCRVRPPLNGTDGILATSVDPETGLGELSVSKESAGHPVPHKKFAFDKVFGGTSSQPTVYEDTAPLIRSVLDGFSVCIFAYGQTGSGKTFTMQGPASDPAHKDRGVNYRALEDLFAIAETRTHETAYEFNLQILEIYNEQLRDLLVPCQEARRLDIRNTQKGGSNVPDASQIKVKSSQDVIRIMELGESNRSVGGTKMNERSSRSHSIVTVVVKGTDKATGVSVQACLHLIDLAGSERVGKSEAQGERLREAQHINKSLSALGDVMASLASKAQHIPYRNSKLTQLLQDSLAGQAKVLMFAHVSPEEESRGETLSTLQFAQRVSTVTLGQAAKNVQGGVELIRVKHELAQRTQELGSLQSQIAEESKRRQVAESAKKAVEQEVDALKKELQAMKQQEDPGLHQKRVYSSSKRSTRHEHTRSSSRKTLSPANGQHYNRIQQAAHEKLRGRDMHTPRDRTRTSPVSYLQTPQSCSSTKSSTSTDSRIPRPAATVRLDLDR